MKKLLLLQITGLTLTLLGSASAAVLVDYSTGFTSLTNLTLNGAANQTGSTLHLTGVANNTRGTFYYNTALSVTQSFDVNFTFNADTNYAHDSLTFIMQNSTGGNAGVGLNALGYRGGAYDYEPGSFGYAIQRSVVVRYGLRPFEGGSTMGVAITTNSNNGNLDFATSAGAIMSTGAHTGQVSYDYSTQTLTAYLDGVLRSTSIVDISAFTGGTAYFGFGSYNNAALTTNTTTINTWTVSSVTVPEPSTVASLSLGFLLMIGWIRRSSLSKV